MKKIIYIGAFIVLGILVQFLIHASLEIWYIGLLLKDFSTYSLGLSWENWFLIHNVATAVFLAAGILIGFYQGNFWWRKIYGL